MEEKKKLKERNIIFFSPMALLQWTKQNQKKEQKIFREKFYTNKYALVNYSLF